jgi:Ca2+-binding EF-hand superfamily protein
MPLLLAAGVLGNGAAAGGAIACTCGSEDCACGECPDNDQSKPLDPSHPNPKAIVSAERIGNIFDFFDLDGDGSITEADGKMKFRRSLTELSVSPDSDRAHRLRKLTAAAWEHVSRLDTDEDGAITREEYLTWACGGPSLDPSRSPEELFAMARSGLEAEFALADEDEDGVLSRSEFIRLLAAFGFVESYAVAAFAALDLNDSESISQDEYFRVWHEYFSGADIGLVALFGA